MQPGKRAYFLQNRLKYFGYTNTVVLEGATFFNDVKADTSDLKVSPEDITRVKALGFLHDKRTPNKFNARVITRNGKISSEESEIIAEAARKFGSGEITMTTRLTLKFRAFLMKTSNRSENSLQMPVLKPEGTGSKVRPVVSCKGTTCQYGLIDTLNCLRKSTKDFITVITKSNCLINSKLLSADVRITVSNRILMTLVSSASAYR